MSDSERPDDGGADEPRPTDEPQPTESAPDVPPPKAPRPPEYLVRTGDDGVGEEDPAAAQERRYGDSPRPPRGGSDMPAWAAFKYGWESMLREPSILIAGLVVALIYVVPMFLMGFFQQIFMASVGQEIAGNEPVVLMALNIAISIAQSIGMAIPLAYIQLGWITYLLKQARGQRPEFGDLFQDLSKYPVMLFATLIFTILTTLGSYMCILPGVFASWIFMLYAYLVVDRGAGALDSLAGSMKLVLRQPGQFLLFWLLQIAVSLVGCALLFIGLWPAMIVYALAMTWMYLWIMGEEPDGRTAPSDVSDIFA